MVLYLDSVRCSDFEHLGLRSEILLRVEIFPIAVRKLTRVIQT